MGGVSVINGGPCNPLYLVGGAITILKKYEFDNGKDDIPYIMENNKCSKPPPGNQHVINMNDID